MPKGVYDREFMPPRDLNPNAAAKRGWISDAEKRRLKRRLDGDLSEKTLPLNAQRRAKWARDMRRAADIRFLVSTHLAQVKQATVADLEALSPTADASRGEDRRVRRVLVSMMQAGEIVRITGTPGRILRREHIFALGTADASPRRIGRPPKSA